MSSDCQGDILIIDDQTVNLNLISRVLSRQGYRVRPAINGELALQSARKYPPDLILLDIVMPGMDGFEVCKRLKADEVTRHIPVIFISSMAEINEKLKAFEAGGVDYITKPFQEQEILARVKTHLTLRAIQTQLEMQNERLEHEIKVRRQTEQELEQYKTHLEELVAKRTAALESSNNQLREEIIERQQAEQSLRQSEARYRNLAQENKTLLEQARQDARTKTILLNEVNHRVKNNLSAIIGLMLTEQRFADSDAIYQLRLKSLISRIQGLATVHSMLSAHEWQPLLLSQLTQQIIGAALQLMQQYHHTTLEINDSPLQVTPAQASSLALVLNELAINSVKHAYLPQKKKLLIQVDISSKPASTDNRQPQIILRFADNGPGYPQHALQKTPQVQRLGLYLVNNLVRHDLGGQLTLDNDGGAVSKITFPQRNDTEIFSHDRVNV